MPYVALHLSEKKWKRFIQTEGQISSGELVIYELMPFLWKIAQWNPSYSFKEQFDNLAFSSIRLFGFIKRIIDSILLYSKYIKITWSFMHFNGWSDSGNQCPPIGAGIHRTRGT